MGLLKYSSSCGFNSVSVICMAYRKEGGIGEFLFIVAAAAAATLNSRKHHLLQQVHRPVLFVALRTSKDELFSPFVVLEFSSCSIAKQASKLARFTTAWYSKLCRRLQGRRNQ